LGVENPADRLVNKFAQLFKITSCNQALDDVKQCQMFGLCAFTFSDIFDTAFMVKLRAIFVPNTAAIKTYPDLFPTFTISLKLQAVHDSMLFLYFSRFLAKRWVDVKL